MVIRRKVRVILKRKRRNISQRKAEVEVEVPKEARRVHLRIIEESDYIMILNK